MSLIGLLLSSCSCDNEAIQVGQVIRVSRREGQIVRHLEMRLDFTPSQAKSSFILSIEMGT